MGREEAGGQEKEDLNLTAGLVMPASGGGLLPPVKPPSSHQLSHGSGKEGSQYAPSVRGSSMGDVPASGRASQRQSGSHPALGGPQGKRRSKLRSVIQHTRWYHGNMATSTRLFIHGKLFTLVSLLALLLALFLPDVWVIAGVDSDTEIDVVLTVVMVMFASELLILSAVDATYFLGFFFVMDLVGTVSMIFDISFMLGPSHMEPDTFEEAGVEKNLMLLRAARAARVGARAGRLSRVLRMLRYMPFLKSQAGDSNCNIAKAISGQLANLLATRVACLTIVLVMVIPLFDVLTFPQVDYSLQTWAQRLSQNLLQGRPDAFRVEVEQLADFYKKKSYGPFRICLGLETAGKFRCTKDVTHWTPLRSAPPRGASILQVSAPGVMVFFNMHGTLLVECILAILNIFFIMFIMVFSGLALSNVVTALAVRPLERMLQTVKDIAQQVFKFRAEVDEDYDEDEEEYDIDTSSEMMLLEKVVQKLAIVADLQSKDTLNVNTETMEEEDIGILNMMQGQDLILEKAKHAKRSVAVVSARQTLHKKLAQASPLEECGVTREMYESLGFNALALTKQQRINLCSFVVCSFHEQSEGFCDSFEEQETLNRFIIAAEKEYLPNPFHNFAHACDVAHAAARIMRSIGSEAFLTELEQYALMIGAIAHDLGHPGVNNGFLAEVGHDLALQYNDKSPLENMHCAKLYTLVTDPNLNVFGTLTRDQYKEVRKHCIETILHTDMMGHNGMVKDLQILWQMHAEIFTRDNKDTANEMEVFNSAEHKVLAMNCLLHSADVSNPCRLWLVSQAWAMVVLEEFFAQGDQEKLLGVPVQFLNDRDKLNRPNSQIGFIEFVIAPFFAAQIRLWPKLAEFGDQLANNLSCWNELWAEEVGPGEEQRAKVAAGVQRVKDSLDQAKTRHVA